MFKQKKSKRIIDCDVCLYYPEPIFAIPTAQNEALKNVPQPLVPSLNLGKHNGNKCKN